MGAHDHDPIRDAGLPRVSLRAAWDEQAEAWTRWARKPEHDSYWRFGREAFFELLPSPGRLTLDIGCGEGRVSRDLKTLGHRVVSIDASWRMVQAAASAAPDIPVVVADGAALPLVAGCSDLVVAYMSLHDMDDMQQAVMEAARVLQPGGRLCVAVVHPINSAGHFESLEPDSAFMIEGSYLEAHPYASRVDRDGLSMTFSSHHYPLGTYFEAMQAAGFVVEALREVPVGVASSDAPRHERWRRLPLFLNVRAVKPKTEVLLGSA
jgi:SAM-dependent methyltransferase